MRIAIVVGERVMLTVVGDPGNHRALNGHRPYRRDHRPERTRGLKCLVGEHPVEPHRHPERGDHVDQGDRRERERHHQPGHDPERPPTAARGAR